MFSWSPCSRTFAVTCLRSFSTARSKLANRLAQFSPKATRNMILYKTRSPSFHLSRQKKSNIARKLPHLLHVFFSFLHISMEEKLSFPVFPRINDESTSEFIHMQSSPQKKPKALSFSQLDVSFHWIHVFYAT